MTWFAFFTMEDSLRGETQPTRVFALPKTDVYKE